MPFEQFRDEFIECFQKHIIDAGIETYVESIDPEIIMTSHGHGISFKLKDVSFGPVIALEGIINSVKNMSMEQLTEIINNDITTFYHMNVAMPEVKCLEPDQNVILTALPTKSLHKNYGLDDIEYNKDENLGLTVFVKTLITESKIPNAYAHIRLLNEDEKQDTWTLASLNTLNKANILVGESSGRDEELPILMDIMDVNHFADYFYLLYKIVLSGLGRSKDIKYFTVFPLTPHHTKVIGLPKKASAELEKDFLKKCLYPMMLDYYKGNNDLPIYKFDVEKETFSTQMIYVF